MADLQDLNFPPIPIRVRGPYSGERLSIFDPVRRRYVALTPEEWVRQHVLHFLIAHLHYPRALIQAERGTKYHRLAKRMDVLCYDRGGQPFLLVECKSPVTPLDRRVFDQAAMYNSGIGAPYLAVTNGLVHLIAHIDPARPGVEFTDRFPSLPD